MITDLLTFHVQEVCISSVDGQIYPSDRSSQELLQSRGLHRSSKTCDNGCFLFGCRVFGPVGPSLWESPTSVENGCLGLPKYRRTAPGNPWISKMRCGTGWAPSRCPSQNVYVRYKIFLEEPLRIVFGLMDIAKS